MFEYSDIWTGVRRQRTWPATPTQEPRSFERLGGLIGIMTNRNTRTQRLPVLLVALAVLAGCRPGSAEDQDNEQRRTAAEQALP